MTELYQGFAQMFDESPDSLTVLSCDSGSDKSFDFLGVAKVMEQIRELIIALWDRVVFFKEKRLEAQMDVIIKGLPVLAKVTEMQSTGKLGPEQAEIIRRFIEGGTAKFLHAGAIIPEIREHAYHEPRALMAPEKKLLMPPSEPENGQPSAPHESDKGGEDGDDFWKKQMLARLERMEQQQATDIPKPTRSRKRTKPEG